MSSLTLVTVIVLVTSDAVARVAAMVNVNLCCTILIEEPPACLARSVPQSEDEQGAEKPSQQENLTRTAVGEREGHRHQEEHCGAGPDKNRGGPVGCDR